MININDTCERYLDIVYQNTASYCVSHENKQISDTYGEISYNGVSTILKNINLSSNDVFYDLGSGLGKLVLQLFLISPIKAAYGVELSPILHAQSVKAANRVSTELPGFFTNQRTLSFILGDLFKVPLNDATVVLLGSPCFGQAFTHAVGEIINKTPSVRTVLTLRPFNNLSRLRFKKAIRVAGSWDSALCYIYG